MPDVAKPPALAEYLRSELVAVIDLLEEAIAQPDTAAGEVEALGKIDEAMEALDQRRRVGLAWCFETVGVTLRLLAARLKLAESTVAKRVRDQDRRALDELL